MIHFTPQERLVLILTGAVLLCGSALSTVFKTHPDVLNMVNVVESARLIHKVDINTATEEELTDIPFIGAYTARSIISRRETQPFKDIKELLGVKGVRQKNFAKFSPYLKAGGTP